MPRFIPQLEDDFCSSDSLSIGTDVANIADLDEFESSIESYDSSNSTRTPPSPAPTRPALRPLKNIYREPTEACVNQRKMRENQMASANQRALQEVRREMCFGNNPIIARRGARVSPHDGARSGPEGWNNQLQIAARRVGNKFIRDGKEEQPINNQCHGPTVVPRPPTERRKESHRRPWVNIASEDGPALAIHLPDIQSLSQEQMEDKTEQPAVRFPESMVYIQNNQDGQNKEIDLSNDKLLPSDSRFLVMLDDRVESNRDLSFPGIEARNREPSYSKRKRRFKAAAPLNEDVCTYLSTPAHEPQPPTHCVARTDCAPPKCTQDEEWEAAAYLPQIQSSPRARRENKEVPQSIELSSECLLPLKSGKMVMLVEEVESNNDQPFLPGIRKRHKETGASYAKTNRHFKAIPDNATDAPKSMSSLVYDPRPPRPPAVKTASILPQITRELELESDVIVKMGEEHPKYQFGSSGQQFPLCAQTTTAQEPLGAQVIIKENESGFAVSVGSNRGEGTRGSLLTPNVARCNALENAAGRPRIIPRETRDDILPLAPHPPTTPHRRELYNSETKDRIASRGVPHPPAVPPHAKSTESSNSSARRAVPKPTWNSITAKKGVGFKSKLRKD